MEKGGFAAAARLVARRFPTWKSRNDLSRVRLGPRLNLIRRERSRRGTDRSISRLSRIHCRLFSVRSSTLGTRGNRENTRVLSLCLSPRQENGQRGGLEIGECALECPPIFRQFCGERVKPGEIHRRCAYSFSP